MRSAHNQGSNVKIAFLTAVTFLLLTSSLALAQVATIDTRGQQPTGPSVPITEGTGSSGAGNAVSKSLEIKLSLPAQANLVVGEPFDYELLVTNKSAKEMLLPQSLSWSDVEDGSEREQRYEELETSLAVIAEDGDRGVIEGNLVLYGKDMNPASMIALKPGASIRILGRTTFDPVWNTPPAPSMGMRLVAYLAVNSARLRPKSSQGDSYSDDEQRVYWAQSQEDLDVEFQMNQ